MVRVALIQTPEGFCILPNGGCDILVLPASHYAGKIKAALNVAKHARDLNCAAAGGYSELPLSSELRDAVSHIVDSHKIISDMKDGVLGVVRRSRPTDEAADALATAWRDVWVSHLAALPNPWRDPLLGILQAPAQPSASDGDFFVMHLPDHFEGTLEVFHGLKFNPLSPESTDCELNPPGVKPIRLLFLVKEVNTELQGQPDIHEVIQLSGKVARFYQPQREITVIISSCPASNGSKYIGTSAVFVVKERQVSLYVILGSDTTGCMQVDTAAAPILQWSFKDDGMKVFNGRVGDSKTIEGLRDRFQPLEGHEEASKAFFDQLPSDVEKMAAKLNGKAPNSPSPSPPASPSSPPPPPPPTQLTFQTSQLPPLANQAQPAFPIPVSVPPQASSQRPPTPPLRPPSTKVSNIIVDVVGTADPKD